MVAGEKNLTYSPAPTRLRRSPLSRLSAAHLLMVIAAGLAFTVNLVVLRSRDDTAPVVVVAAGVGAGEVVEPSDFRLVEVDVDESVLSGLFGGQEVDQLAGMVAAKSLVAGELLSRSALIPVAAASGLRAMSVPIDPAHAVGGLLVAGDRIDLIHVTEAGPEYVIVGAEILSVANPDRSALTGTTGFHVVLAVDADSALKVAAAISDGKIELVRSTGAIAIDDQTVGS